MQKIWRLLVSIIFALTVLISIEMSAMPTTALAASGSFPGCPVLAQGSQGPCVKMLQQYLRYWSNLNADGIFGSLTLQATVNYQRLYGLVPDGVVGSKTATALRDVDGLHPLSISPPPTGTPANYPSSLNLQKAADWAVQNPASKPQHSGDPCTEFVSKALEHGGLPHTHSWYPDSDSRILYIYNQGHSSLKWDNATALKDYLVFEKGWTSMIPLNLYEPTSALMAQPGDLIYYQWDGTDDTGHTHMTIVTGMNNDVPLMTEQTGDAHYPNVVNETWNVSYTHGGKSLSELAPLAQAYLLHWRETHI